MEAPPRFELGNQAFAELCLTTWLWCHALFLYAARVLRCHWSERRDIRFRLSPSSIASINFAKAAALRTAELADVALDTYFCTQLAYFDVTGARDEIFASGSHCRALLPSTSRKLPLCGQPNSRMSRSTLISVRCSRTSMSLERETRFELATFALARQRSTTEPLSHILLVETIGLEPMTPCL